jgi:hypothetical protein
MLFYFSKNLEGSSWLATRHLGYPDFYTWTASGLIIRKTVFVPCGLEESR